MNKIKLKSPSLDLCELRKNGFCYDAFYKDGRIGALIYYEERLENIGYVPKLTDYMGDFTVYHAFFDAKL